MRPMSQSTMRKAADAQNKQRRSKHQEEHERKERLERHVQEMEAACTVEVGKRYRINNPSHINHGREIELTHTAAGALRATMQNPSLMTIWSGWCSPRAVGKVGSGWTAHTTYIEECYLEPID